ncbi:hypothetical protein FB99_29470 [Pantoea agglomerans]|nr:hypothetical protein FB99_29470 [Pantoea agglomerans]
MRGEPDMATSSVAKKQGQKVAVIMSSFSGMDNPNQVIIQSPSSHVTT